MEYYKNKSNKSEEDVKLINNLKKQIQQLQTDMKRLEMSKDTTHLTIGNSADGLANGEMKLVDGFQDDEHQGRKQTDGLKGIRKHQCADAASAGVEPDEQHHAYYIHNERNTCWLENKLLEDNTNYIKPHRSTHHLGKQEEPGARLIRTVA